MTEKSEFQTSLEEASAYFQALGFAGVNGVLSLVTVMAQRKMLGEDEV
ncbi:MAG: hypothetical protein QOH86_1036 [Sphingomonadales bacterium]|nr:hypothetical protein [Sphingomonadales bacterium]